MRDVNKIIPPAPTSHPDRGPIPEVIIEKRNLRPARTPSTAGKWNVPENQCQRARDTGPVERIMHVCARVNWNQTPIIYVYDSDSGIHR